MSQRSLFGSEPEPSISSPADSRVPISASPGKGPAWTASSPGSGAKCSGLSAESRRLGASLRTFLRFALAGRSRWSLIWRRAGIPSCRLSWWVLGRLELHTEETGSGSSLGDLWGTPRVTTNGGAGRDRGDNASRIEDHEWPTVTAADADRASSRYARGNSTLLGAAGAFGAEWATPRASEAENRTTRATPSQTTGPKHTRRGEFLAVQAGKEWPTPTSSDAEGGPRQPDGRRGALLRDMTGPNPTLQEWATPRSSDAERGRDGRRSPDSQRQGGPCLAEQLAREWPTPAATEYGSSNNGSPRDGRREEYATKGKPSLEGCAREEWPTPTARDWRSTAASTETHGKNARPLSEVAGLDWPTPTASDANGSGSAGYSTASGRHPGTTLTDATVGPRGPLAGENRSTHGSRRGSLNPTWVESLMGAPPGWTDLPEETTRKLYAERSRGKNGSSGPGADASDCELSETPTRRTSRS